MSSLPANAGQHTSDVATTAQLVSDSAHDLKNQVAIIASAAQAIDDPEIAEPVGDAARALMRQVHRLVVVSRIELDHPQSMATITVRDLLSLASRRARREGWTGELDLDALPADLAGAFVAAPGTWLERLVCEFISCSPAASATVAVTGQVDERGVRLRFPVDHSDYVHAVPLLQRIAGAVGADIAYDADDGAVRVRLVEAIRS